jgi:hypothetical protein
MAFSAGYLRSSYECASQSEVEAVLKKPPTIEIWLSSWTSLPSGDCKIEPMLRSHEGKIATLLYE